MMLRDRLPQHIEVREYPDRESWLAARKSFVSASEAASILGDGYESAFSLWHLKRGADLPPIDPERLEAGRRMEPVIAQWYEDVTQRPVETLGTWTLVINPEFPWLCATLDRLTEISGEVGPLELKNANAFKLKEWDDDIPLRFHVQNQVQMICTASVVGSVASIVGGTNFRYLDTQAHKSFQQLICTETKRFHESLASGECPEPDGSDATTRCLAFLHPKDSGGRVALPLDATDWIDQYETLTEEVKAKQAELEALKNKIKSCMGNASVGYFPGGEFSWKHQGGRPNYARVDLSLVDKLTVPYEIIKTPESRVLRAKRKEN